MSPQPRSTEPECSGTIPSFLVGFNWVLVIGGAAIFVYIIAVYGIPAPPAGKDLSLTYLVTALLVGWLGVWWSLTGRGVRRVEASEAGLHIWVLRGQQKWLCWKDVASASWRTTFQWGSTTQLLILQGRDRRTVLLSNRLSHFEELVAFVGAHLPPTVELPPRPPL